MAPTRGSYMQQSLGISLTTAVKAARVLLVGAGGIGCELLKNLVLTGFGEVYIVDLDTIDLSNLNRQFLFSMQHIKKSKALVRYCRQYQMMVDRLMDCAPGSERDRIK